MNWPLPYNTTVVLSGVTLLGASAGVVGAFALLRRRSLTGDALAHAALPGLCLAFLAVGEKSTGALLVGAGLSGVLGITVIAGLCRWTRIREDAAIGIVLSVFFGVGVVLSSVIQRLAGGSRAGLESFILGKTAGMVRADVYLIGGLCLVTLAFVGLLYKEFKLVTFDPAFARVQGWPAFPLDLLLLILMALTVVVGLPAVGILLIAALLIIPAATARFWTERFSLLLGLAALIGAGSGIGGTLLSDQLEKMPAGPSIVLTGTAFFLVSLFFAPRRGLVASWLSRRILRDRLARHRLLCTFFDLSGCKFPQRPALPFGVLARQRTWSPRRLARLLRAAQKDHVVDLLGDGYTLTDVGLCEAAQAARRQRLWEALLHDYPDQALHYADLDPASLEENVPAETKEEVIGRLKAEGRWSEYFG